jgi:hypothetical protein
MLNRELGNILEEGIRGIFLPLKTEENYENLSQDGR